MLFCETLKNPGFLKSAFPSEHKLCSLPLKPDSGEAFLWGIVWCFVACVGDCLSLKWACASCFV